MNTDAPDILCNATEVSAGYGKHPVLRDVSVAVRAGEVVALVGPNGSGKSTLLKTLLGRTNLSTGIVSWFGRPLHDYRPRELARRVAYLPQSPSHLPGQRVGDVIATGRAVYAGFFGVETSFDHRQVLEAAEMVGLADRLEDPIDTLSGGQRQRVFVARCLAQLGGSQGVLLLDEPDTFLDMRHVSELGATIRRLSSRGIGILIASHDLNFAAAVAGRLVLLREGVVVREGATGTVLDERLLGDVYGTRLIVTRQGDSARVFLP